MTNMFKILLGPCTTLNITKENSGRKSGRNRGSITPPPFPPKPVSSWYFILILCVSIDLCSFLFNKSFILPKRSKIPFLVTSTVVATKTVAATAAMTVVAAAVEVTTAAAATMTASIHQTRRWGCAPKSSRRPGQGARRRQI